MTRAGFGYEVECPASKEEHQQLKGKIYLHYMAPATKKMLIYPLL
jgi:hypothetical protein